MVVELLGQLPRTVLAKNFTGHGTPWWQFNRMSGRMPFFWSARSLALQAAGAIERILIGVIDATPAVFHPGAADAVLGKHPRDEVALRKGITAHKVDPDGVGVNAGGYCLEVTAPRLKVM